MHASQFNHIQTITFTQLKVIPACIDITYVILQCGWVVQTILTLRVHFKSTIAINYFCICPILYLLSQHPTSYLQLSPEDTTTKHSHQLLHSYIQWLKENGNLINDSTVEKPFLYCESSNCEHSQSPIE